MASPMIRALASPIGSDDDRDVGVDYWDDAAVAWEYDADHRETNLFATDLAFLERHFRVPGRLIDLGCGTGRAVISFARRGFDVVGVDRSRTMLDVAETKGRLEGLTLSLVHADLHDLSRLGAERFDYASMLFNVLGLGTGESSRRAMLANAARLLKPGGLFALHAANWWASASSPQGRGWLFRDLACQFSGGTSAGDRWFEDVRGGAYRVHLFRAGELRKLLRQEGFKIIDWRPLSTDRRGELRWRWLAGDLRGNGWLILARKR